MPILFQSRLGTGEADRKLRKIYRLHHALWTLYYALLFAGFGFGIAILVAVTGNLIFACIIAVITIGVLVAFFKRQVPRRRRR
ncbi:MAG TPA: hypothetical protein VHZ51_14165 [Ktedonobacteraceae bacterium]|nr:hypothetical protein [Ktedonobacteraceae bacterium]